MAGRKKRLVMLLTRKELEPHAARFFEKVLPTNEKGCQLWRSGFADGDVPAFMLGRFNDGTLMNAKVTRFAWAYAHGECPVDHIVIQRCGDSRCVATEHLKLEEAWTVTRSAVSAQERVSLERYRENFLSKVIKRADGCWFWNAARFGPYGAFWFNGKERLAHRVSYELFIGPVPKGLVVRHKCDRKICVNPDHLEPGTHADNAQDTVIRDLSMRGEKNGNSELEKGAVLVIKIVWAISQARGVKVALARWFEVTQTTVGYILARTTWWYEEPAPEMLQRAIEAASKAKVESVQDLIVVAENIVGGS